jgi:hypothetical protein
VRVVVEPESLRATARTLRGAVRDVDHLGQQISYLQVPEMPGGQQGRIQARLRTVGATVRHSGNDLPTLAGDLERRALWAVIAGQSGFSWDPSQYFTPYFDGRRFLRNPTMLGSRRPSRHDRFFRQEGSKNYGNWSHGQPRYDKGDMERWRQQGPKTRYGDGGAYFVNGGRSAAVRRWGGDGPVQVAAGEVYGGGKAGVTWDHGVKAVGEATAGANLVRGSVAFRGRHGGVEAGGSVGANAKAKALVGVGKEGVQAGGGASAFAGGEVHTSGNVKVAGVDTKASAGVSYGIGGNAEAEGGIDKHGKIKVKARLGATLGVGVNVGVDVEVDPVKTGKDVIHGGKSAVKAVGGVIDSIF